MGRKEDLEQHIHESYQLIREYEEILQTSSDPKERTRAERAIKEQRSLIKTWQVEYRQVSSQMPPISSSEPTHSTEPPVNEVFSPQARPTPNLQKPIPWPGHLFVALLSLDLIVIGMLGWRFLRDQPELLSYLQVVTGFLTLALEISLLGIVLQRKMSLEDVLRWLGTSRPWQGIITIVTLALLAVVFWSQANQTPGQTATEQPAVSQDSDVTPDVTQLIPSASTPSLILSPTPVPTFALAPIPSPLPTPASEPALPPDSIAVIGFVQGKVKVQRNEERLITAVIGLALFKEDVVTTPEQSEVHIYCFRLGLFKLSSGRVTTLSCDGTNLDTGLELISPEFPAEIDDLAENATGATSSPLTSLNNIRGHRLADLGSLPILLSPGQLTHGAQPTFRWTAVTDAESYVLKVEGKTDTWNVEFGASELRISEMSLFAIPEAIVLEIVYPADAPPLEPNITYFVTLQARLPDVEAPQESNESLFFELVDETTRSILADGTTQIQDLTVPDIERAYLLSLLYRQHGLWIAAAEQMEILAQSNPQAPPLVELGNLYLKAGLTDLAMANYQHALDAAHAEDDLYTEAAALTGLGQATYAAQADDKAIDYFEKALTLYRELEEEKQASAVESLLAEIK